MLPGPDLYDFRYEAVSQALQRCDVSHAGQSPMRSVRVDFLASSAWMW